MQVQEELKLKIRVQDSIPKFEVLILNIQPSTKSFDGKILGRTLSMWVRFACGEIHNRIIDFSGTNILEFVKENISDQFDYTIVLMSSTPLIERGVIQDIIEYCTFKKISLCKLPVGYVVKNSIFKNTMQTSVDSLYSQHIEDFYVVENKKQYSYALEVLQERINTFHQNNGVEIKKPRSVYIEPEVDVASGVIIYPNNTLKGKTVIGENVILKENNVIENSRIGKNSCVSGSEVVASIVANNVYISAFCQINNGLIGEFSTLGSGAKINNYNLTSNSKVKPNTVLGEENDSDSRSGQSGQEL